MDLFANCLNLDVIDNLTDEQADEILAVLSKLED